MSSPPTAPVNSGPQELDELGAPQSDGAQLQQLQPQTQPKWPGWPGDNVFRLIVPVVKVGSIIGRKGELIKKMCDETRARIRILEGPLGIPDRVVSVFFPFSFFIPN